ncbi:MAG: polysulfide reductase NrfD [Actinobacteria bacterium]|nr:polysulfide reductase NrfD [Actinomycetota bacterium]MBT3687537.1 polysulfide reductase NrfD [Actinomycetota bacterium]MBT4037648.1 polysulfide reductase NrfD [Actinomycetota bacterium]MBT4278293.1 polysulfide reductase NrfD [Actinomycetota bacterium]MBT4343618.1 polysulfide reductase NrfD [Actinomycetota bacterium]
MTRLGFVLDSGTCIGCHACTVACKSEHDVPLGVNRTWLKYVETGSFPDTDRSFSVMRCNHCQDAPCMDICPTSALYRADNGVVDFNDANCIGCKGCMNACPYDAIYINPATSTAHKCNFCNHRVTEGLEPACVIVCPTQAIRVGDLDDPDSEISQLHSTGTGSVRSPAQNTNPAVIYKNANPTSLDPLASSIRSDGMIWSDTLDSHPSPTPASLAAAPNRDDGQEMGRTVYTTRHPVTWGSMVSGYLVTKAVAAGVMLMAALLVLIGHGDNQAAVGVVPPMVAGAFLAATGVLLVGDLKQPGRFHYLITRGNWSSWLVKGAYVLAGFAATLAAWWVAGLAGAGGVLPILVVPAVVLALGTAGYTAFLFGQCEGRDLWQEPLLLPVLLIQAVVAGGATYSVLDLVMTIPEVATVRWVFLAALVLNGILVAAEMRGGHSRHVTMALAELTHGDQGQKFRIWLVAGLALPCLLLAAALLTDSGTLLAAPAGLAALAGMFAYEDAYVRAGQSVPLS